MTVRGGDSWCSVHQCSAPTTPERINGLVIVNTKERRAVNLRDHQRVARDRNDQYSAPTTPESVKGLLIVIVTTEERRDVNLSDTQRVARGRNGSRQLVHPKSSVVT